MTLHEQLKSEMKEAMKAKNAPKLATVRSLLAAFVSEGMTKGYKPDQLLTDAEALVVIKRASKQRKDAIDQFTAGGRADLAETEQAELAFIETYLPTLMTRGEIQKIAEAKLKEIGPVKSPGGDHGTGKFIGALMRDLNGKADGADVKAVAEELLN